MNDLVVYSQYYRTRTPERQLEIEECLRRNLNHPGISRMVVFTEKDAPPLPEGSVPVEVVRQNERLTYAEWFRWVKRQDSGIGLLLNADIYLDKGLEHLKASFNTPEAFLALTRYNPGHAGFHLNDYPHWTQDLWGLRADAELEFILWMHSEQRPAGVPMTRHHPGGTGSLDGGVRQGGRARGGDPAPEGLQGGGEPRMSLNIPNDRIIEPSYRPNQA